MFFKDLFIFEVLVSKCFGRTVHKNTVNL